MYGGLIYSDDPNTFKHYWDHGDVKILAHGSNGVTCLVTVPGGKTFLNEHGKKVDTILIKLVPIKEAGGWEIELPSKHVIHPVSMKSVRNEYEIQKWLYERALLVLKYELCPCPTGIVVMKVADVEAKIKGLTVHHDPAKHLLRVGVIVMQYIANYTDITEAPPALDKVLMAKSRRLLVDAYSIGVIHGDPIRGNFLWNKDTANPKVIMIDFGAARKSSVTSVGFVKNGIKIRPIQTYPAFTPILARLNDVHDPKVAFPDIYFMAVLVINLMYSKNVVEFWRHEGSYYYAWVISDQNKEIETPFRTTPWSMVEHPFSHKEGFTAWIDSDSDYRVVDQKWTAAVIGYRKMMNLR